jgi:hypothetical protein
MGLRVAEDISEVRHHLAILARRKKARRIDLGGNRPCKWWPTKVMDPRTGQPFTLEGAWEYAAEKLEEGLELDRVELENPPGKFAYAMTITTSLGTIYIKLELGSGVIWGRSFHESTPL